MPVVTTLTPDERREAVMQAINHAQRELAAFELVAGRSRHGAIVATHLETAELFAGRLPVAAVLFNEPSSS